MSEYVQRFREVKNRCYSSRITEKEAVDLAVLGLTKPIKDMAFQLEFASLAHLVQKLTAYELYHPELYQDKFKRHGTWPKRMNLMILARSKKWPWQSGLRGQTPSRANGLNSRGL